MKGKTKYIVFGAIALIIVSVFVVWSLKYAPDIDVTPLVNNIHIKYDDKERTLSLHEINSDKDGVDCSKLLVIDIDKTLSDYSKNESLSSLFGDILNGYANEKVKSRRAIRDIISDGVKRLADKTDYLLVDAIGITTENFFPWELPNLPDFETIILPNELIRENSGKTLSFITDDYYVNMPSNFFNESGENAEAIVTMSYDRGAFNVQFANTNYTNWEHPILIKINRKNYNTDALVLRDGKKVARSFQKDNDFYIYAYTGGKYEIEEIPINNEDNPYLSFVRNREILSDEILHKEVISRADFIAALFRSGYTEISSGGNNEFTADVSNSHEYIDEFNTASGKKIVLGVGSGALNPDGDLTIQDMYTILDRFINYFGIDIGGIYTNTPNILNTYECNDYAKECVEQMRTRGFILPNHINENGYMYPNGQVKTKEAMELIYKLITEGGGGLDYAKYHHES